MSPRSEIRLFLILPVYGNWGDTVECLRVLQSQTTRDFRVLIADDESPTAPPEEIYTFDIAEYVRNPHSGFGGNCNLAAKLAIDRGATHLLFLNSDTAFSCEFMTHWLATVERFPRAILSPMIYLFSDPSEVAFSGGPFDIWTPFFIMKKRYQETTEVDIVSGCAILIPVEGWTAVEGFDPIYGTYFEDFDICLRAKAQGIATYVVPDKELSVRHKVGGSFEGANTWKRHYLLLKFGLIFVRIHYRGVRKWLCFGLAACRLAVVIVANLPQLPNRVMLWKSISQGVRTQIP